MPWFDMKCPKCLTEFNDVKHTVAEISAGVKCEKCGEVLEIQHHSPLYFVLKDSGVGWPGRWKK
jgi:uncharacterized Zn finger protein